MRLAPLAGLLLLVAPLAQGASPQEKRQAAALMKKADADYKAGRYREAAEGLKQAQELNPNPRILYNIARAYDQAGDLSAAIEYYQRYINDPEEADPVLLKRASLAMSRIRGLLDQQQEQARKTEEEHKRLEQEAKAADERAQREGEAKKLAADEAERRKREQLVAAQRGHDTARVASYLTAGVGLVGFGFGGFFGWQASQSYSAFHATGLLQEKTLYRGQTQQNALIADIGFGVGVAAAVTAVLLFPKSPRPELASLYVGPTGAMVEVKF